MSTEEIDHDRSLELLAIFQNTQGARVRGLNASRPRRRMKLETPNILALFY